MCQAFLEGKCNNISCKFLHTITKNTDIELIAKLDLSNGVSKNSIKNILQLSSTAYLVC